MWPMTPPVCASSTSPTRPTLSRLASSTRQRRAPAARVAVAGHYLYLSNDDNTLRILDIANPANPTLTGQYLASATVSGMAISGNHRLCRQWRRRPAHPRCQQPGQSRARQPDRYSRDGQ